MTRPLITPNWREAPVEVQRWMERVTQILTGSAQGGPPRVVDGAGVAAAIASSAEIAALSGNIQSTAGAAAGSGLYATYSPASVFAADAAYTPVTTAVVTVTPVGGTGPYTHSWTYVSGEADVSPANPTSGTTAFNCVTPGVGQTLSSIWRDTIEDSLGATYSLDVGITVSGRFDRSQGLTP